MGLVRLEIPRFFFSVGCDVYHNAARDERTREDESGEKKRVTYSQGKLTNFSFLPNSSLPLLSVYKALTTSCWFHTFLFSCALIELSREGVRVKRISRADRDPPYALLIPIMFRQ